MTTSPIEQPAAATFVAVFSQWRGDRGLTKKHLAAQMGFDPSYLSHIERGRHRPTADFARRAELILRSGGAIWQAFVEYEDARAADARGRRDLAVHWRPAGVGPVVDEEVASLSYQDQFYRCVVQRSIFNAGTEPIARWLARIAVDRYPHDPEHSNAHHRAHPLSLAELELFAVHGVDRSEPMRWRAKHDRDALKEIWLLFENDAGRFPLNPGQRATIEYGYRVHENLWGRWFQRAVRLPTGRLAVQLDLPDSLDPQVWGVESSLAVGETPLRTPVVRHPSVDRSVFTWETEAPPVHARYTLHWRFRLAGG
ncbi:MAG: helix-turn-helix domain-containing protein [Micromonosporaceae bacterium]|nr:helix-turn-helix domain-containing protein [Micromonosporaceae bacterium]